MTSLLAKQVAAFKQEHGITSLGPKRTQAPSVLFSPQEAKQHDNEAFAALALHGLREASHFDPDIAAFAPLFEGPMRDRDLMTRDENNVLDKKIHQLLLLLSPHIQSRAAQEVLEGLLHRYHVHRWNVDDILAATLPHHDSPLFTTLVQGLQVEGKPRWSWLSTLKAKPATLIRSALAKYCCKDISVLSFVCDVVQETLNLQKTNRALFTFFAAVWLDTLAILGSVSSDMVETILPTLLLLLRRPHLRDAYYAGLAVAGTLCAKVDLEASVQSRILLRTVRQVAGEEGKPSFALLATLMQLQTLEKIPEKAVSSFAEAGSEAVIQALPAGVDSGNLLASIVEASLLHAASAADADEDGKLQDFALGILRDAPLLKRYAVPLSNAVLQAFVAALSTGKGKAKERRQLATKVLQEPVAVLAASHPVALGAAFRRAVDLVLESSDSSAAEPLAKLLAPACATVAEPGKEGTGGLVPAVQAFSHKSSKVRAKAVQTAVAEITAGNDAQGSEQKQRLMASLALQAVEDDNLEVAGRALRQEALWTSTQVAPTSAVSMLESLLIRLLAGSPTAGDGIESLFHSTLLAEPRVRTLVPLVVSCCAWVYGRSDCDKALQENMDRLLLPLMLLAFVGLDAYAVKSDGAEAEVKAAGELKSAVMGFVAVSKHKILTGVHSLGSSSSEGDLGPLGTAAASSVDASIAEHLCGLVQGRSDEAEKPFALGGAATQVAAAAVLAGALPRLASAGKKDKIERLVSLSSEVCQRLVLHLSLAPPSMNCVALSKSLWKAVLSAAVASEASAGSGRKKRTSGATPSEGQSRAIYRLLLVALEYPRTFMAELKLGLGSHSQLLRPVLLRIALEQGPRVLAESQGAADAAVANAMLLLRSLIVTKSPEWTADQSLIVPVMSRLSSSEAPAVRSAALQLLETLESPSADGVLSEALMEAGVLQAATSVLSEKAWASVEKRGELPAEIIEPMMQQLVAHKAEMLQDRSAVCIVLSKLLGARGSMAKAARQQACRFWALGLSQLTLASASEDLAASMPLLKIIPGTPLLAGLKDPLQKTVKELLSNLSKVDGRSAVEAPSLLHVVTAVLIDLAEGVLSGGAEKARGTAEEAVVDFMKEVTLPLCLGFAELCEAAGDTSWGSSVARLACHTCRAISRVSSSLASQNRKSDFVSEAMTTLFRFCTAVNLKKEAKEAEAEDTSQSTDPVPPAAAAALSEAPLDATLLQVILLQAPALKNRQFLTPQGETAAELLCLQVTSLGRLPASVESGGLLTSLAEVASAAAKRQAEAKNSEGGALSHLLLAVAALSEQLAGSAKETYASKEDEDEGATAVANAASSACFYISELCSALGPKLGASSLAAVLRACGALALLVPNTDSEPPLPLKACMGALSCYTSSLSSDLLALLRGNLRRLWQYPVPGKIPVHGGSTLSQARLRTLLHIMILGKRDLIAEVNGPLCLSLAQSAGARDSLDFVLLLFLARLAMQPVKAKPTKRRKSQRRRKGADDLEEEEAEEMLATAPTAEEHTLDEALAAMTSVDPACRYHCLGMLLMTLCSWASELSGQKVHLSWGQSLLPEVLTKDLGVDVASSVLRQGFVLASRFITEHGLPADLDEQDEVDTSAGSITNDGDDSAVGLVAATALCHSVRAICMAEVLLGRASGCEASCVQARELRALLLRSLTVNHPLTFFKALCMALGVEGLSPSGDTALSADLATVVMRVSAVALQERRDLREKTFALEEGEADLTEGDEAQRACAPLCAAAICHISERFLSGKGSSAEGLAVAAWRLLESLCRFSGAHEPGPLVEKVLPAAGKCLASAAKGCSRAGQHMAIACCLCVETCIGCLGRGLLDCLKEVTTPLLDLASNSLVSGEEDEDTSLLDQRVLETLCALARSVGAFLSPFLGQFLQVATMSSLPQRTPLLQKMGTDLVAGVPHRLLLQAVQTSMTEATASFSVPELAVSDLDAGLVRMQRLAIFQIWILVQATPEMVAANSDSTAAALLRLLEAGAASAKAFMGVGIRAEDLPIRLVRRDLTVRSSLINASPEAEELSWAQSGFEGSVRKLHMLAAAAFAQYALRLELDELKARFLKVLDWARGKQQTLLERQGSRRSLPDSSGSDVMTDAEDACRVMALNATMTCVAAEAPGVAEELFLPLGTKDLASSLTASRCFAMQLATKYRSAARKRRKAAAASGASISLGPRAATEVLHGHSWWWFEVASSSLEFVAFALKPPGGAGGGVQPKSVEDAVEELRDPCAALLELFEFMPTVDESALAAAFLRVLQSALVALAFAASGEAVKRLVQAVLEKARSEDAEVRLSAVRCVHRIWTDLGVQVVPCLSEVVMYASELMEDEDNRIETAVRAMVKTIEDCTGESLQDSLKQ